MLPEKKDNIYPRTVKNIEHILFHFFSFPISKTKEYALKLYEENQLELNQIEFIAKKVSENLSFFESGSKMGMTLPCVMGFGITAYTVPKEKWKGSPAYMKRISEFVDLLQNK